MFIPCGEGLCASIMLQIGVMTGCKPDELLYFIPADK